MSRALVDPFLQRLAWTLVHFLWQGAALGILAWMVLTLLRRGRPQVRYAISCLFLAACALVPVITLLRMNEVPRLDPAALQSSAFRMLMGLRGRLQPVLPMLLVAWSIGVGLFALRSLAAWMWLHRIRSRGQQLLERRWQACVDGLRRNRGIRRAVPLLESDRVRSPLTTGLLRPVILVPFGFFTSLDPLAAEAVLAHELAHIRRLDVLVIGLQTVIETLLFYHPAVWWISRRVANEREQCCDDDAVKACGDAVLFAQILKHLDDLREVPLALAPGAGGGDLMERIKRLLAIDPGPVRFAAPGLSAIVALTLCATTLAAQQPPVQQAVRQLVALGSRALHGGAQEAKGIAAAAQQFAPQEPEVRTSTSPAPPAQELVLPPGRSAAMLEPDRMLVQAPEQAKGPLARAEEPPPGPLDPTRLGFAFSSIANTSARIEAWPEAATFLEAQELPPYDADLSVLRSGRAESTRLLRLSIPAYFRITLSVRGTSGGSQDLEFDLDFLELKSLMPWGCWVGRPKHSYPGALHAEKGVQGTNTIVNASEYPQSVVVVINGPKRTSYRLERMVEPIKALGEPSAPGYVVEAWPAGAVVDSASAPEACTQFQPGLVALFPGDGRMPSDPRREGIVTPYQPSYTERDWHPRVPGFPHGLILYRPVTHLRCLALDIQPGEGLEFSARLGSQVLMEVVTPRGDEEARWLRAVQAANEPCPAKHSRSLKVQNPTASVQKLILVLYRLQGMEAGYTIALNRSIQP